MEQNSFIAEQNEEEPKKKRKRRRPHTKGYRLFLKNEIEKALCAQSSSVSKLFSVDSSGCSSADLHQLITLLELNTEQYRGLSVYALKSISNISTVFRIDGNTTYESLRIFRKCEDNANDASVVYVDNLPKNCRVLYILQRASMFGTVVSIRARFFGDKRSKLYYTFTTDNAPSASTTTDPLLNDRRVESAFIRFVDPTSADKFCKAYRHNLPGKFCSPGKQKKFFTKRKKSVQRAIAFQRNLINRSVTVSSNDSLKSTNLVESCFENDVTKNDDDESLASSSFRDEQKGLKRRADTVLGNAKKVCFGNSAVTDTSCNYVPDDMDQSGLFTGKDFDLFNSDEHSNREKNADDKQLEACRTISARSDVEETAKTISTVAAVKKKRHRKKSKKRRTNFKRRCKVHHVTRYFLKMQVLPLATFVKLRNEYMSLKKANIVQLKRKLKLEKVPLKTVVIKRSRFKKIRGRCKVLLRAAALRDRISLVGSLDA